MTQGPVPHHTPPYPAPEPVVVYSMKEIVDQINTKLNVLPALVAQIGGMEKFIGQLDTRVTVIESDVDTLKTHDNRNDNFEAFRTAVWAKIAGASAIIGTSAGIIIGVITLFF